MGMRQHLPLYSLRKVNGCKQPPKLGDRVVFIDTPRNRYSASLSFNPGDTPGVVEEVYGDGHNATVRFDEDVGGW